MGILNDVVWCGEWQFYLETKQRVRMYRPKDGAVVVAEVINDNCAIYSIHAPLPLYCVNQLREMLNLQE